jgi:hypothetical protein
MAGPGNVRKTQDRQSVEIAAHIALRGRTLPDQPKTPTKTTDRQSRTFRPFIWPSIGRVPLAPLVRPSLYAEARWASPQREIALASRIVGNEARREPTFDA